MNSLLRFVFCAGLALLVPLAAAAPPQTINYQGYLTSPPPGSTPVNSAVLMTFRLYDASSGGSLLWTEIQPSVTVANGSFNATLGLVTPIGLPFDAPYWLTVTVNADGEMSPRQALSASPYAFRALSLDGAATVLGSQVSGTIANAALPASPSLGGNLTLVDPSTASAGNVMKGVNRFIHNYGVGNTFAGVNAGNFSTTGSNNTAIGESALQSVTNGSNNTAIGASALRNHTGINGIAVGSFAGGNVTGGVGNIHIGNFGLAADSGTMRIGSGGVQTQTFIAGIRGVTPSAGGALPVVIDSQGQLGTGAASLGTVTSVATGAGLTGGPITGAGTINLATTQLLPAIACTTNQIVKWNGSAWVCATEGGLPILYTGTIVGGQPVITSSFDRSTWQVMGAVTPPAGNYFIVARVNGQTESTTATHPLGAYFTNIDCELLLEPTVPRPRLDFVTFSAPAGTGASIEKITLTSYVGVPAGGSISLRCRTGGGPIIPASTLIGAGGHIDAIPVRFQVNG